MPKSEETPAKRIVTPQNFLSTCRICFVNGHLYDTKTSMFEDQTIDELFTSLINAKELNIAENYAHVVYPQFICLGCIKNLVYSRLFLDQCSKAHRTLSKVYAYLTLYQHKSVVISKPIHAFKDLTGIVTKRCKLNRGAPKVTLELEKATSHKKQEVEVLNEDIDINFELNRQKSKKLNVYKKRAKKRRVSDNEESIVKSKKQKILETSQLDEVSVSKEHGETSQNQQKITINKNHKRERCINKNERQETINFVSKIPKPKAYKNVTSTKTSIENPPKTVEENMQDDNLQNMPLQIANSCNVEIYGEYVEGNKIGIDPDPADFFTNISCNKDKKQRKKIDLSTRQNNNVDVRRHCNKPGNICQTQLSVDVSKNDNFSQGQLSSEIRDNEISGSTRNVRTCHEEIHATDINQARSEEHLDDVKRDISNADEIQGQEKFDTVKLSHALADINRDRRNIDLDHSYTNKNVYKNVRYIMPRLNFQRINDLLYPAPDVAKKKDVVLAGNITKRMASILSGNAAEKSEEYGEVYKDVKIEPNMDEASSVTSETCIVDLKEVKLEPRSEDDFDHQENYGYITPEFVEMDPDDFNLMHLIKKEPCEEFEYRIDLKFT